MSALATFDAHCVTKEDNVAIVIRDVAAGETVAVHQGSENLKITAATAVPAGHKIALHSFKQGDRVLKYGEVIGVASNDIPAGTHVHDHNLEGLRGRGDKL
ncbi:MAG: UxaA family hydrolase [Synergistaceae bacterium]|nr:UxaA family hydrolase [Synergistaceae bacterium]